MDSKSVRPRLPKRFWLCVSAGATKKNISEIEWVIEAIQEKADREGVLSVLDLLDKTPA